MIEKGILKYLQEIPDADWVQEAIAENFDGVLELMTPHSVVYGGAVRDCLAGMELIGDLDIAVSQQEFSEMSNRIQTSPKWLPKDCSGIELEDGFGTIQKRWQPHKFTTSKSKGSGELARKLAPMSGVVEFVGAAGRETQLITSKQHTKDPFQDALYMARMVDIICCGVIMTSDGRVFEVVPGAYQDCKDRVLRLNDDSTTLFIEALPERVAKLEKRGWKNLIDVNKALEEVRRKQALEKRREERRLMATRRAVKKRSFSDQKISTGSDLLHAIHIDGNQDGVTLPIKGGEHWEYQNDAEVKNLFGGDISNLIPLAESVAHAEKINVSIKITPWGSMHFNVCDYASLRRFQSRFLHEINNIQRNKMKRPGKKKEIPVIGLPTVKPGRHPQEIQQRASKLAELAASYQTELETGRLKASPWATKLTKGFFKKNL